MRFLLKSFGFYKTRQKCFEIAKYLEFSDKMKTYGPITIILEKKLQFVFTKMEIFFKFHKIEIVFISI